MRRLTVRDIGLATALMNYISESFDFGSVACVFTDHCTFSGFGLRDTDRGGGLRQAQSDSAIRVLEMSLRKS
jgi:hypothetical protein